MAGKAPLRAVKPSDRVQKPLTLKAAADTSERELLVAMRDKISDELGSGVPPHTLAPLMRQLREIDKEIRALDFRAKQEPRALDAHDIDDSFNPAAI